MTTLLTLHFGNELVIELYTHVINDLLFSVGIRVRSFTADTDLKRSRRAEIYSLVPKEVTGRALPPKLKSPTDSASGHRKNRSKF